MTEERTNEHTPHARAAIAAAQADGFAFAIGREPGLVIITPPDKPARLGSDGLDSGARIRSMMRDIELFRAAVIMALRADGAEELPRTNIEGDYYPMAIVLQVKPEATDRAERVQRIKRFMADRYPNIPFIWEGQYIEMCNFDTYYAVTFSCPDPGAFDVLDIVELHDLGLIDNFDFD